MTTCVSDEKDRKQLAVPWDKADHVHFKLAELGIGTTVCLNIEGKSAALELWPGVDPDLARAELARMYPEAGANGTGK